MDPLTHNSHLHNRSLRCSEGISSSTLRARLSSQGPPSSSSGKPAPSSSPNVDPQLGELYSYFRARFAITATSSGEKTTGANSHIGGNSGKRQEGDFLMKLSDSFAQAGLQLHSSVVDQLSEAQTEINTQITAFSNLSSSILSDLDKLYANLAYPLSATLCHSANFPRGTIATHLSAVQGQLKEAEEELQRLRRQWEEISRLENDLRRDLASMDSREAVNTESPVANQATEDRNKVKAFRQEAENIVKDKFRALEEVDAQYKEWIQAETMEMMQYILAD